MKSQESNGRQHNLVNVLAGGFPIRVLARRPNRVRFHLFFFSTLAADTCGIWLINHSPTISDNNQTCFLDTTFPYYEEIQPDCWDGEVWIFPPVAGASNLRVTERWR